MTHPADACFAPATAGHLARLLVIAEVGVNHDGRLDQALSLVTAAAAAGADAVKLQLFNPRHLLSNQARLARYQREAGAMDPYSMLDRLRLSAEDMAKVRDAARLVGMKFVVTPFSLEDLPELAELRVDLVKIASPDVVNVPLLKGAAELGLPLLISTGASEADELAGAADLLRHHPSGGALMQCVSSYPTSEDAAALGAIPILGQRYDLPVGYSDHTTELTTGALAVAAGACVLEKHITYDRNATGPDHAASLDPVSFTHYVDLARQAVNMLGPLVKQLLPCEAEVRSISRQSLCAKRDLPADHVLEADDLTVKRPGTGIPAADWDRILGRKLLHPVRANDLLRPQDLME